MERVRREAPVTESQQPPLRWNWEKAPKKTNRIINEILEDMLVPSIDTEGQDLEQRVQDIVDELNEIADGDFPYIGSVMLGKLMLVEAGRVDEKAVIDYVGENFGSRVVFDKGDCHIGGIDLLSSYPIEGIYNELDDEFTPRSEVQTQLGRDLRLIGETLVTIGHLRPHARVKHSFR